MSTMSIIAKMKIAGKSIVDSGAKTMLKTDVVFLDREIKGRKQRFGVEVYELMEALEIDNELSTEEKEGRIRTAFDRARKDIAVIQAKIDCKNEEMAAIDEEMAAAQAAAGISGEGGQPAAAPAAIPPSTGTVITDSHPGDAKTKTQEEEEDKTI